MQLPRKHIETHVCVWTLPQWLKWSFQQILPQLEVNLTSLYLLPVNWNTGLVKEVVKSSEPASVTDGGNNTYAYKVLFINELDRSIQLQLGAACFPPAQEAVFLLCWRKDDELRSRAATLPSRTHYSVVFLGATDFTDWEPPPLSLWSFTVCLWSLCISFGIFCASVFVCSTLGLTIEMFTNWALAFSNEYLNAARYVPLSLLSLNAACRH